MESAINAEKAGADRIELCSELGVGGVTPSHGLIKLVKEKLSIPVHVLIRPRSGHFTYSKNELKVMLTDIQFCKDIGVEGIVSGVLNENFLINKRDTELLVHAASGLRFTFHRAFDWVPNMEKEFKKIEALGVNTVLTSGQQSSAKQGLPLLKILNQFSENCTIMAGGGINASNAIFFKEAGIKAIHLSGTVFRAPLPVMGKIPMNSKKHLDEGQVAVTNMAIIRQTVQAVK